MPIHRHLGDETCTYWNGELIHIAPPLGDSIGSRVRDDDIISIHNGKHYTYFKYRDEWISIDLYDKLVQSSVVDRDGFSTDILYIKPYVLRIIATYYINGGYADMSLGEFLRRSLNDGQS